MEFIKQSIKTLRLICATDKNKIYTRKPHGCSELHAEQVHKWFDNKYPNTHKNHLMLIPFKIVEVNNKYILK